MMGAAAEIANPAGRRSARPLELEERRRETAASHAHAIRCHFGVVVRLAWGRLATQWVKRNSECDPRM